MSKPSVTRNLMRAEGREARGVGGKHPPHGAAVAIATNSIYTATWHLRLRRSDHSPLKPRMCLCWKCGEWKVYIGDHEHEKIKGISITTREVVLQSSYGHNITAKRSVLCVLSKQVIVLYGLMVNIQVCRGNDRVFKQMLPVFN